MTVEVTHEWKDYDASAVLGRYVRYTGGGVYHWIETGRTKPKGWIYDIRGGTCTVGDLPPDVAMAAVAAHNEGVWPPYVTWPTNTP